MTSRKPRVLHLVHWLTTGGIERWLLQMLSEVDRNQYELDFCCKGETTGSLAPLAESLGAKVWHIPLDPAHVSYATRLHALIREQEYHIVHNHLAVYAGMPALVARAAGVPSIVSFHNTDHSSDVFSSPLIRWLRERYSYASIPLAVQLADIVTGCARGVVQVHIDRYGAPASRSRVLYYGVEMLPPLTTSERDQVRQEIGVPETAPVIVHVGRMAPQKNHVGLVRIAARFLTHRPDAVFVLVGDGSLRSEIEAEIAAQGVTPSFRVLGIRNDVERILRAADVFLLPSFFEGLPVVSIEAQSARLPCVGTDLPGMREAIEHGKTGFLLPVEATDSFVNTLRVLLDNDDLRTAMGEFGRQRVERMFSRTISAQHLCALYDECLRQS